MDSKRTIRYESISDILISMFSGVNKYSQGRNIFVIDFGLSRYQKFVISLIRISTEFPAHNGTMVLVWNNALDFTFGNKGALHWSGLYIVVQR